MAERAIPDAQARLSSPAGKDLLTVADVSRTLLSRLLRMAKELKRQGRRGGGASRLTGKTLGLLFEKPSTRTRVSFEAGMNQLGGRALFLSASDIQLSRGESIRDTAQVLSRYLDGLVIRTYDQAHVEAWARAAAIPVINGLSDLCHPCQALSDLLTIHEHKRRLRGLKLAYVGDGNNIANSLMEVAAKAGMWMSLGCPSRYEPDGRILEQARSEAEATGGRIDLEEDPMVAVKDADVIYTDVWISMGQERERSTRLKALAPYQVNTRLLEQAHPEALVMHCLPAHRGEEITGEILDGPRSIVLDQAENRLHMQKAILVSWLNRSGQSSDRRR